MTDNQEWVKNSPGWILVYEEAFLESLTRTLPTSARLVNIGSGAGTSSAAMLRGGFGIENLEVLSIDIEPQALARELEYIEEQGLYSADRFRQFSSSSDDVFKNITNRKVDLDLVFVDGSHHGEQVYKDIMNYTQIMKPGGILVCHDYGDPRQADVTGAINKWHDANEWFVLGRAIYTIAFLKPGGDLTWTKDRIEELREPEPEVEEEVDEVIDEGMGGFIKEEDADVIVKEFTEAVAETKEQIEKEQETDGPILVKDEEQKDE